MNASHTSTGTLEELLKRVMDGGEALRELQNAYDEVGWRIQEPSWAKARHLLYHLLAVTSKLALMVEEVEHAEERGEVTTSDDFNKAIAQQADICAVLVFHATQLANMGDVDLGSELGRMYQRNAQRFAPESAFARLRVGDDG